MKSHSIVRTLYLYLFSLVGLVMMTVGSVQLVNLGLTSYVFKEAETYPIYPEKPRLPFEEGTKAIAEDEFVAALTACEESCELTDEQSRALSSWLEDYEQYQEDVAAFPERSARNERQRRAANALAFLFVGSPLFGFHWRLIRRDYGKEA